MNDIFKKLVDISTDKFNELDSFSETKDLPSKLKTSVLDIDSLPDKIGPKNTNGDMPMDKKGFDPKNKLEDSKENDSLNNNHKDVSNEKEQEIPSKGNQDVLKENKEIPKKNTENQQDNSMDIKESPEKGKPIQNKIDGLEREAEVKDDLENEYPQEEGYEIQSEAYLRDKDGNIVKDQETGQARRIDFVVIKDSEVVDSIEVTSQTADKTDQTAKENRIRENGGNYIRDNNGNLVEIPSEVQTRIERRE